MPKALNSFLACLVLAAAAICEVTLCPLVAVGRGYPHPLIVAVLFFALFGGSRFGLWAGFAAGLMLDICGVRFFGSGAMTLGICGYLIGLNNARFYRESPVTHVILTFALMSLYLAVRLGVYAAAAHPHISSRWGFGPAAALMLPSVLYTVLISPFIMAGLLRMFGLCEDPI